MEKIIGLIDAPFTPFDKNGEVNYAPIGAYARMLAKNGLKGVFINGSSGEGYMLTEEERMRLAEEWMRVAPAGFKVIVHVGSCWRRLPPARPAFPSTITTSPPSTARTCP